MTYYDIKTSILVTTDSDKIVAVEKKPTFVFDNKIVMTEEERFFYGRVGTAYHSGKRVSQMSDYLGKRALVNYASSVRTGTIRHYSVCESEPNLSKFKEMNLLPFFTDAVDIMPILGYVVVKGKIKEPCGSLFEKTCNIEGETIIEIMEGLEGDNIGQMVQLIRNGIPVYNRIYDTVFENPFYGCTLSLLPLKDMKTNTVIMTPESFCKYFKGVDYVISELTKSYPVELDCDKEVFGFEKIRVYTGNQPALLSGFWGFLRYFTKAQVDFVYSYQGQHSNVSCGYNKVVVEKNN